MAVSHYRVFAKFGLSSGLHPQSVGELGVSEGRRILLSIAALRNILTYDNIFINNCVIMGIEKWGHKPDTFKDVDTNKDGLLNYPELSNYYKNTLSQQIDTRKTCEY